MKKNWVKKLLFSLFALILLLAVGGFFYLHSATYTATKQAEEISRTARQSDDILIFEGDSEKPAVIFYQGAFVEESSYSIWAQKVADAGYSVYVISFPLNLPVLDGDKAQSVIEKNKINDYYIGGHSLGGVMASRYASRHNSAQLKGVFFMASYPDAKGTLESFQGKVLSLTASKDGVLNQESYEKSKEFLPEQTINEVIEGGNHGGFGSYGMQKGDEVPTITNEEQQEKIAAAMIEWLQK